MIEMIDAEVRSYDDAVDLTPIQELMDASAFDWTAILFAGAHIGNVYTFPLVEDVHPNGTITEFQINEVIDLLPVDGVSLGFNQVPNDFQHARQLFPMLRDVMPKLAQLATQIAMDITDIDLDDALDLIELLDQAIDESVASGNERSKVLIIRGADVWTQEDGGHV